MKSSDKEMTRKDEILKTARRCFARHGFAKTTVDDIAQAVGMKTGSLYHYYNSKEAMFRDVVVHEGQEMLYWLKGEAWKEKTPAKKVLRYTKARLDYFRKVTNLHDVSIQIIIEVKPLIDKLYRDFLEREIEFLASVINEGIKNGSFRQCNSRRIANTIMIISEAVKLKAFHLADTTASSEVDYTGVNAEVNYVVRLILEGITAKWKLE